MSATDPARELPRQRANLTVAILAQGTSWAVAVTQAFFGFVAVAQLAACQLRSLSANVWGCTAASLPELTVGVDSGSITGIRAQARAPQSALPLAPFLFPVLPRLAPQGCFLLVFRLRCHSRGCVAGRGGLFGLPWGVRAACRDMFSEFPLRSPHLPGRAAQRIVVATKYTWPGSNWRPSACGADVIATRPQVLRVDARLFGWSCLGLLGLELACLRPQAGDGLGIPGGRLWPR